MAPLGPPFRHSVTTRGTSLESDPSTGKAIANLYMCYRGCSEHMLVNPGTQSEQRI